MADCLVYWKVYWQQTERFGKSAVTPDWDTKYEYFPDQVEPGDNIWVVMRDGDRWSLIQRISIKKIILNRENGIWDVKGDRSKSETFDIQNQPDFTPILRRLNFASGKKITKSGAWIGTQIQRPRPLSDADVILLNKYARTLQKV
jgi:hypothetical protein